MIIFGNGYIREFLTTGVKKHYISSGNIIYLIDLIQTLTKRTDNFTVDTKSHWLLANSVNFVDYSQNSADEIDRLALENYSEDGNNEISNIVFSGYHKISGSVGQSQTNCLHNEKIELLFEEHKTLPHNPTYKKRKFPSLGGLANVQAVEDNNAKKYLHLPFHQYQWRYRHDWAYLEAMIDLGHAKEFLRSCGYSIGPIELRGFAARCEIKEMNKTSDWRFLNSVNLEVFAQ